MMLVPALIRVVRARTQATGLIASVLAFVNVWPRLSFFLCWVCFLSFVAAAGEFSGYQSDGMLLEAGLISLFLAPPGLWPGWGATSPPLWVGRTGPRSGTLR